jgi:hypothetical protein
MIKVVGQGREGAIPRPLFGLPAGHRTVWWSACPACTVQRAHADGHPAPWHGRSPPGTQPAQDAFQGPGSRELMATNWARKDEEMRRPIIVLIVVIVVAGVSVGGYLLWDSLTRISSADLVSIVQRDGVSSRGESIPDEVVEMLAPNRVVILGEMHFLREHREFVAELLGELHARGFRQYLFEWSQAADWLLSDYVSDGGLEPDFTPPHDIGGDVITAIRDFNRTLPESERIEVHGVDVHLPDYGGTDGWVFVLGLLADHLPDPGPIAGFLNGNHSTFESHTALLEDLRDELQADRTDLVASWGDHWYDTVAEMVEVELLSVPVRSLRESDYERSVRLREDAIKLLADRRISNNPGGTLINIGNTHAQKEGLWGTEGVEWLGAYLAHRSPVSKGSTMALTVVAAYIVSDPGSGSSDFDLSTSPANELFRVINETWPEERVFLPLDDPLFSTGRVPLNMSGDIYVSTPKRQFDAIILLPLAHRDFVGD